VSDKYYQLLKKNYQTKEKVLTEIINLNAICELPKGTEHFVSDIHGEFPAFLHVLRNGSGSIKEKIDECFPDLSEEEKIELCFLIYYPKEKLQKIDATMSKAEREIWYPQMIVKLLQATHFAGKKYTRSKLRKALPTSFSYIIEELLNEVDSPSEKEEYFHSIIEKIMKLGQTEELIEALSKTIRRLTIDHLHVVGDIYDRGPAPDLIMDSLMEHHSVDIQWGNHDIVWLGIVAGSALCMLNVLRICARYNNLDIIEERYGVTLRPFIQYAQQYYISTDAFQPKIAKEDVGKVTENEKEVLCLVQQAAAILQFKLETALIKRRPEFQLGHRDVLNFIDYEKQTFRIGETLYPLKDFQFSTINIEQPEQLTSEEEELVKQLMLSFQSSEKLARHMDFLLEKGSMYLCYNDNLLIHGCIPMHENGDFKSFRLDNQIMAGKELLDFFEKHVRQSMENPEISDDLSTDILWYLWIGENSSLFGKYAMTTFERYYLEDKETHKEKKNAYYQLRDDEFIVKEILKVFGLSENGHIINGHTPVKVKAGEDPIKANGRLIVIDGGFSKAYQKQTGIAGYTLLSNSYGMQLSSHQPFSSIEDVLNKGVDTVSVKRLVDRVDVRKKVKETNVGKKISEDMRDLEYLYERFDRI